MVGGARTVLRLAVDFHEEVAGIFKADTGRIGNVEFRLLLGFGQ